MGSGARKFKLRCFAFREKAGQWVAMCVDLSLAAQGDSFKEASAALDGQIKSYLEDLNGIDREHFKDLFPRRAPLGVRVLYHYARFRVLLDKVFPRANAAGKTYKIPELMHCPN